MPHTPSPTKVFRRVNWVIYIVNGLAALLTFLYFSQIDPLPPASAAEATALPTSAYIQFAVIMVITFTIGIGLNWRNDRKIINWAEQIQAGFSAEDVPPAVRRLVLNYPITTTLISGVVWLLVGLFSMWGAQDLRPLLGITGVGGVFSVTLVYFCMDVVWRPMIRLIFPHGQLTAVPSLTITLLPRFLAVFLLVSIGPPALLAQATWGRAVLLPTAENPALLLQNLRLLQGFILGFGILASISIAIFMTRGILHNISQLQLAMSEVADNNLDVQVPVTSKDELGYLSQRFNDMVRGLRQGEMLRNLLNLYVSPEVARAALQDGAKLGGELVDCTVLFSDIRDFTTISETLPPQELITLLNLYMSEMVGLVVAHGGIVNKFGGDSLLAIFGTPLNSTPHHAAQGVSAAFAMQHALASFNKRHPYPVNIRIGVGLATGAVIAGNVGGQERLEYTVIGDTVNLAARLQDKTKELGASILVSEPTYEQAKATMALEARPFPNITVKGKRAAMTIYGLLGE
ncbi:MAG: HAMP domain-containing protein [Chloroflexi bacterium]|nr:HAMP domain-containing protein [Chloroflexota bacterium]